MKIYRFILIIDSFSNKWYEICVCVQLYLIIDDLKNIEVVTVNYA